VSNFEIRVRTTETIVRESVLPVEAVAKALGVTYTDPQQVIAHLREHQPEEGMALTGGNVVSRSTVLTAHGRATDAESTGRWVFWINATQDPAEHGGYVPSKVDENEDGYADFTGNEHAAPWVWGDTYDAACRVAAEENDKRGYTADEARDVVASSMFRQARGHGSFGDRS
jgi:hypothetical protein